MRFLDPAGPVGSPHDHISDHSILDRDSDPIDPIILCHCEEFTIALSHAIAPAIALSTEFRRILPHAYQLVSDKILDRTALPCRKWAPACGCTELKNLARDFLITDGNER